MAVVWLRSGWCGCGVVEGWWVWLWCGWCGLGVVGVAVVRLRDGWSGYGFWAVKPVGRASSLKKGNSNRH